MNIIKLIKKLIQIPSIFGGEAKIQKFIASYLSQMKYQPIILGRNLLIHIPGYDSHNAILFNAHVDTVSEGELSKWKYPPFSGKVVGGRIYGLGASDEKAGVSSLLLWEKILKNKNQIVMYG